MPPALYVFFYNPDGSQIMHTEVVTDHEAHDFSGVSYDAGTTSSVTGWSKKIGDSENIASSVAVPEGETSVSVYAIISNGNWVTFDAAGGTAVNPIFVPSGEMLDLGDVSTSRPGYRFSAWYNGDQRLSGSISVDEPMRLTAHWDAQQVQYTINYWQQKVTDAMGAEDSAKTYDFVESVTGQAQAGSTISVSDSNGWQIKSYNGFERNDRLSSQNVTVAGDGSTIINVYYDRVVCTVNFYTQQRVLTCGHEEGEQVWVDGIFGGGHWETHHHDDYWCYDYEWAVYKTVSGLYQSPLPEDAWDTSYAWNTRRSGGTGAILLTSFDFEEAGYGQNEGNESSHGVDVVCNFYGKEQSDSGRVYYYNEQADGSYRLVGEAAKGRNSNLTVHQKYVGYDLYKMVKGDQAGNDLTDADFWNNLPRWNDVSDGDETDSSRVYIASRLKTYTLSFYNHNQVSRTVEDVKYTASLSGYSSYEPARPDELPRYFKFQGWYKDPACTQRFDFSTETMPNANLQLYALWAPDQVDLTYDVNAPVEGSQPVTKSVDAGTVASTVLPADLENQGDYVFSGWVNAEGNPFNIETQIYEDTTVYGKWLYTNELRVSYVTEYGAAPSDSNNYYDGAKGIAQFAPEYDGMYFLGWETEDGRLVSPGNAFEVTASAAGEDNVLTLTAVWGDTEPLTTLTYNPGSGIGAETTEKIGNNTTVVLKDASVLEFSAPEAGYIFIGWSTSLENAQSGEVAFAANEKVVVTDLNEAADNVLYACWQKSDQLTYIGNGATSGKTEPSYGVEGGQVQVAESGFTRVLSAGDATFEYSFVAWDPSANPEDDSNYVYPDESYTLTAGNDVLYAVWNGPSCLQYDLECTDASWSPSANLIKGYRADIENNIVSIVEDTTGEYYLSNEGWYNGDEVTVENEEPSRPGYTFRGWYYETSHGNVDVDAGKTFDYPYNSDNKGNDSLTLHAKWQENKVDVNYVASPTSGGWVSNESDSITAVSTDKVTGSTATANDGYKFVGWYKADAEGNVPEGAEAIGTSATLGAKEAVANLNKAGDVYAHTTYVARFAAETQTQVTYKPE